MLSRGFVDNEEHAALLDRAARVAESALEGREHAAPAGEVNARIKDALGKFVYDETRRRPMVLPVTLEV